MHRVGRVGAAVAESPMEALIYSWDEGDLARRDEAQQTQGAAEEQAWPYDGKTGAPEGERPGKGGASVTCSEEPLPSSVAKDERAGKTRGNSRKSACGAAGSGKFRFLTRTAQWTASLMPNSSID